MSNEQKNAATHFFYDAIKVDKLVKKLGMAKLKIPCAEI